MRRVATKATPQIHVLIGLPGSGKSTWVDKYITGREPPPLVLSSDEKVDEFAIENGVTYAQAHGEVDFRQIKMTMMRKLREAIVADRDIIVDQTNMSAKSRRPKLLLVPEHYKKTAVVFVVPDNLLRQRLIEREEKTGKHVPWKVVDDMARNYDPPTRAEFDNIIYVR